MGFGAGYNEAEILAYNPKQKQIRGIWNTIDTDRRTGFLDRTVALQLMYMLMGIDERWDWQSKTEQGREAIQGRFDFIVRKIPEARKTEIERKMNQAIADALNVAGLGLPSFVEEHRETLSNVFRSEYGKYILPVGAGIVVLLLLTTLVGTFRR